MIDVNTDVSGEQAPNFTLSAGSSSGVVFEGVSHSDGSGIFRFNVICKLSLTSGVFGPESFCPTTEGSTAEGTDLSYVSYKLVPDTFGVATGQALTVDQARTIFATLGTSIDAATDLTAGGFETSALNGPAPIASNPNMIFILSNGSSFQYFLVNVAPLNK